MNAWRDAHDERTPEQIAGMGIPVAGEPAKRLEGGKHS
jgi:hypothetical protein